jgi:neutral ceramidase
MGTHFFMSRIGRVSSVDILLALAWWAWMVLSVGVEVIGAKLPAHTPSHFVGIGKGDITGPAAQSSMMGYADPSQIARGVRVRVYARAFIIQDPDDEKNVVTVVVAETGLMSALIRHKAIVELAKSFPPHVFTEDNVCISSTHTHSTTSTVSPYLLYHSAGFGFDALAERALVTGIVAAITMAHKTLQKACLYYIEREMTEGKLFVIAR